MPLTQALRHSFRHLGVLAAAALLVTAVGFKPVAVYAMGSDNPPSTDDGKK